MMEIKVDDSITIDYNSERLVKRKTHDLTGEYYKGTVLTKYGLVDVESHLDQYFKKDKGLYTFLSFAIYGTCYISTIKRYKPYTATGLARVAGKFAKECLEKNG